VTLELRPDVKRRAWFLALARAYVRSRMRRAFDGVYLEGGARVRALAETRPVIVAANHVAWWDPLFAVRIDEALSTTSYALMDEANLARLPFFAWVGALPIDRSQPRRSLVQLRAAATVLDRPRVALWIFPQGTQRPAHLRPLDVKGGVGVLAEQTGALVLPLALNYLFRETELPAALATFGEAIDPARTSRRDLGAALESALEDGLARIDAFATRASGDFEELVAPRRRGDAPPAARLLAPFASATGGERQRAEEGRGT
jgi:1-acyl-sn-glycerol-3-phosphate acyltransferase